MSNRVVHFEIEAKDIKRASNFYSKVFGWEMQPQGEEYGNYIVAQSGPAMPSSDPKLQGINGGLFEVDKKKLNAFRCIIGVDDINKAIEDVKEAGGKIVGDKPDDIPNVGIFQRCEDTEGNIFALLQPAPGDWQNQ